ncbi:hypothetical protein [uncultured Kocuria sp.]|uniref:hypothetical protein n=1 Tax=uncultured Kocuria sp. TaxID=259305 RepID=UPI0026395C35|nr:hypothetical protein [uncultured Kocuria sp.]
MKVKVNRNLFIDQSNRPKGDVVEVQAELGKELVEAGYAEEVKAPKAEAKTETKTKKSSK